MTRTIFIPSVGIRLDKALAAHPEIKSRSRAAKLISQGLVQIKGTPAKPSYITQPGDLVSIEIPVVTTSLTPFDFPLDIVFEDNYLLIINKPAGIVVHPGHGNEQKTLVNALIHYTDRLSTDFNKKRPGIVHRLDKDTSGLLVIAKNNDIHLQLSELFKKKQVHRIYRAVCYGNFTENSGSIRSFIGRHPRNRLRFCSVAKGGKIAITHYKILRESLGLTLVEIKLETGRTHQIRVHLSEKGHPIVGDNTYGRTRRRESLKSDALKIFIGEMNRFALHAAELGFCHPATGKNLIFKDEWPENLKDLLRKAQL